MSPSDARTEKDSSSECENESAPAQSALPVKQAKQTISAATGEPADPAVHAVLAMPASQSAPATPAPDTPVVLAEAAMPSAPAEAAVPSIPARPVTPPEPTLLVEKATSAEMPAMETEPGTAVEQVASATPATPARPAVSDSKQQANTSKDHNKWHQCALCSYFGTHLPRHISVKHGDDLSEK